MNIKKAIIISSFFVVIIGFSGPVSSKEYTDAEIKEIIGIDKNKNGIRDDIEKWIKQNMNQHPAFLKASLMAEKYLRNSILTINNREKSIQSSIKYLRAISCRSGVWAKILKKDLQAYIKLTDQLLVLQNNTKLRLTADVTLNTHLSGSLIPSFNDIKKRCEFNPYKI